MIPSDIEKLIGEWAEEYCDKPRCAQITKDDKSWHRMKAAGIECARRLYAHLMSQDGEFDEGSSVKQCQVDCDEYRKKQSDCLGFDFGNAWRSGARYQYERDRAVIAALRSELAHQVPVALLQNALDREAKYLKERDALKVELAALRIELEKEQDRREGDRFQHIFEMARKQTELAAANAEIARLDFKEGDTHE